MCKSPILLKNGQLIACRKCWQCTEGRIRDWIGRCIAESQTSNVTLVVTLTYGGDDKYASAGIDNAQAKMLTIEDVQGYLKRLRKYTKVRFFAVGEYGDLKGRAHWHIILFFRDGIPEDFNLILNRRYIHEMGKTGKAYERTRILWPHGWSYWDRADYASIRYCCKYILKKQEEGQVLQRISSYPPLGAEFFRLRAVQHVNQGLSPQDLFYYFGDVRNKDVHGGTPFEFYLRGASAYHYLDAFARLWREKHGNELWPQSDLLDDYVDERYRRARRQAGVTDFPEAEFGARFSLQQGEKVGQWPKDVATEMLYQEAMKPIVRVTDNRYRTVSAKGD